MCRTRMETVNELVVDVTNWRNHPMVQEQLFIFARNFAAEADRLAAEVEGLQAIVDGMERQLRLWLTKLQVGLDAVEQGGCRYVELFWRKRETESTLAMLLARTQTKGAIEAAGGEG